MAVKLRCTSCEKVFSVPEQARGRAVRCPGCEAKIRVPAAKNPSAVRKSGDDENILAGIDLRHVEDKSVRVCPKCGTLVSEEDIDCPECGVELATGRPGVTARKRAMKGPDPDLYYKNLWKDSWKFLTRNKKLAIRTAVYTTVGFMASLGCLYMAVVWCVRTPPRAFWGFLAVVTFLIPPGWAWHLTVEVIRGSLAKKDRLKRVHFDMFTSSALGIKVWLWLVVASIPVQVVTGGLAAAFYLMGYPIVGYVLAGIGLLVVLLTFPIMMAHMSMPVTWPGWVSPMLLGTFVSNAGATLYWLLLAFVVSIPLFAGPVAIAFVSGNDLKGVVETVRANEAKAAEQRQKEEEAKSAKKGERRPTDSKKVEYESIDQKTLIVPGAVVAVMCLYFGFASVFVMRANGQFAYYFKRKLGLISLAPETKYVAKGGKLTGPVASEILAGFFPRMAACIIDGILIAAFGGVLFLAVWVVCDNFSLKIMPYGYATWGGIWFVVSWLYFASQESGPDQGTFGKKQLWICVVDNNGLPITLKRATVRYFVKLFTGGIGCLFALFSKDRKALHDMAAGTKVMCRN